MPMAKDGAEYVAKAQTESELDSVQPILDSQARYSFKIGSIGGQEKCLVDQRRRRDFQVPGADAKLLPAEFVKLTSRGFIERHDCELLVKLEEQGQLSITEDLPQRRLLFGDHGQPAAHSFLDRDNGDTDDLGFRDGVHFSNHAAAPFVVGA